MVQIKLTYIFIKSGVVNSNIYWFLNISGISMALPPYYLEVFLYGGMVCIVTMVMFRGWFL